MWHIGETSAVHSVCKQRKRELLIFCNPCQIHHHLLISAAPLKGLHSSSPAICHSNHLYVLFHYVYESSPIKLDWYRMPIFGDFKKVNNNILDNIFVFFFFQTQDMNRFLTFVKCGIYLLFIVLTRIIWQFTFNRICIKSWITCFCSSRLLGSTVCCIWGFCVANTTKWRWKNKTMQH